MSEAKVKTRAKNLVGKVYGKVTVVKQLPSDKDGLSVWLCHCACGRTDYVVKGYTLNRSRNPIRSCGCDSAARAKKGLRTTHGMSGSSEHMAWQNMWRRCTDPTNISYILYKDRAPPERWRSFENFIADMGLKPDPSFSIERIDNNKPYSPENCKWASSKEQSMNRSITKYVMYNGVSEPLKALTERLGVDYHLVFYRLKRGWDLEKALFEPRKR